MARAFVSYASEDRELVKELVSEVEREGHHLWHFERDSPAGLVYLAEIAKAIEACDFLILLASKASLDSRQVTKELEQAHQRAKQILPIFYKVTSEEVRDAQDTWATVLGATAYVRLTDDGLKSVVREIVRVCRTFGPEPARITTTWAADAQLIDIDILEKVVVQTPVVQSFINGSDQYFISANKGVGKTLLLKFKRSQLMAEHSSGNHRGRAEVIFIPEGRPYLDFMGGGLPSLKKTHIEFLSSLRNCARLWSFALRASILSHFPTEFARLDSTRFKEFTDTSLDEIIPQRVAATAVFRGLLSLSINSLNRVLDQMDNNLEYAFRRIHSAAFTFIDRVEQGIANLPQDAWIHVQAGLIEAAWDVMSSNNHVKIYATIREEAYANYGSDTKNNLYSATLPLRYSRDELHDVINSLSRLYESAPGFDSFVGISSVENLHCRLREDSFQYLLRHTLGRPRDLIIICSQLSRSRRNLDESRFREIVNEASAQNIVANVFHEMGVFLDCLSNPEDRNRFFGLIPHNILTRKELEQICCEFNGLVGMTYTDLKDYPQSISHPFCELYNCGLVGTAQEDPGQSDVRQQFKQPHDIMNCRTACLPRADYYLLHPALQSLIHKQQSGAGYVTFRYVAVGHRYFWRRHHGELVDLQRALMDVRDPDLKKEVLNVVETSLSDMNGAARPEPIDRLQVEALQAVLERRGMDDIYLQLDRYLTAISTSTATR
jgi:hypothetical protein